MFQYVRYLRICIIVFVSSIILRLFPIEIPKKYKIEAPYVQNLYVHTMYEYVSIIV